MQFQRIPYRYERSHGQEIRIIRWNNLVWELHPPRGFAAVAGRIMNERDMIRIRDEWISKSEIPSRLDHAFVFDVPEECLGYYRDINRIR